MRTSVAAASWLPVSAVLAALITGAVVVIPSASVGAISAHMALHIAVMNVLAPLAALAFNSAFPGRIGAGVFWSATALQITGLWAWHLPGLHNAAGHEHFGPAMMAASLFILATAFWTSLLRLRGGQRWQGILGLLITGKLSCLLAALLVFAPRSIYYAASSLEDQQMAGLLMITACPLSYVVAGIVMTTQLIKDSSHHAGAQTSI